MKNNDNIIYCGIDVSKKNLDAYMNNQVKSYANTFKGVKQLMKDAGNVNVHYVFESTGGYEQEAAWFLLKNNRLVSIANPKRVRDHARSKGQLAKTDHIDAQIITDYAQNNNLKLAEIPSDEQLKLTALVKRRNQLIDIINQEKNRLECLFDKTCISDIKQHIKFLKRKKESIEEQISSVIKESKEMSAKSKAIQSISGLGEVCAMSLLAYLPELGKISRKEVAALAGLAPYNRDSGNFRGKRHIKGGRAKLRASLYMGAVSAITYNPILKEFYQRLVNENHRLTMVALTAVMRKLLIAAHYAVKNIDLELANEHSC